MEENPKKTDIQKLNEALFPLVYGFTSQSNTLAKELFDLAVQYVRNTDACIFEEKERKKIQASLTKSSKKSKDAYKSLAVSFLCEYGSAIKMTKDETYSPINSKIISLQGWETNSHDWRAKKLQLVNPKDKAPIYLPTVTDSNIDLAQFSQNFVIKVRTQIQSLRSKQRQRFFDIKLQYVEQNKMTELERACKNVIEGREYTTALTYIQRKKKLQNESQDKEEAKNLSVISNQSLFDLTQADTAWYLAKAMIIDLLNYEQKKKWKGQKFIIGLRSWVLLQAIKNEGVYDRVRVSRFKLCLDELIFDYREKVSSKTSAIEKFHETIQEIEQNIIKIRGGELTSTIKENPEVYEGLDLQVRQIPEIVSLEEKDFEKIPIAQVQIKDFKFDMDERFIFEELLQIYKQAQVQQKNMNKWILLTQKTLWKLTQKLNTDKIVDFSIHMRQIQCETDCSDILKLVLTYSNIVNKNLSYYGMQLSGQALSHMELLKAIVSIVAFETVSLNRQKKKSTLLPYRIPLDIEYLYEKFQSNCYEARKAMRNVKRYFDERKERISIFEMSSESSSYYPFARLVAQQTRSAKCWVKSMDRLLSVQKQLAVSKVAVTSMFTNQNDLKNYASRAYYGRAESSQINTYLNRVQVITTQLPNKYYHSADPWIAAFLNNIPPDILGLMKILFQAQNPSQPTENLAQNGNTVFTNQLFGEEKAINIYIKKKVQSQSYYSNALSIANLQVNEPQAQIRIIYDGKTNSHQYKSTQFFQELNSYGCIKQTQAQSNLIRSFITAPSIKNMIRQHTVYSQLQKKPQQIEVQNYQAMCNVRSGVQTQLILLCSNILQRKIISNSYDKQSLFAERLILQTGSSLFAYNPETQRVFGKIQKLIRCFEDIWIYSDTNFCPIIAPMISFSGRQIIDDGLVQPQNFHQIRNAHFFFSLKCWQQFQRLEKELIQRPKLRIRWDQRYLMMAGILCFRQVQILDEDGEQITHLLRMIFFHRASKILADREDRPANKREFEVELEYSVQKAIYQNIQVLSDYAHKNPQDLNRILRNLDDGLPQDITWVKINQYHLRGWSRLSNDIYQIDIYHGCIYKNGKEISCLQTVIKQNKYYKQIFGDNREFHVFPSRYPFYYRTRDCVNYYFKINQRKSRIYFQFSEDGTTIRHIIKKAASQQIWTLIPREQLEKSNCHIPQIFLQNHLAWICQKKRAIIFRKPKFQDLYQISLVIFLAPRSTQIIGASLITYHGSYEDQDLDMICNRQNKMYDEMIFRNSSSKLSTVKPFQILEKFQPAKYIFQLRSRKTNVTYYLLHRYQIKFRVEGSRLYSETHYGYALDYCYKQQKYCIFNCFPCLVLQKTKKDITIQNNHNRIMILSDGKIRENGKITKKKEADIHINAYKYDIHDFFGDIRGGNRQSILYLANMMLSINDNIKIKSIEMTPLQYCIYLIKSCFTNRPFKKQEENKLNDILNMASVEVMLLGQALLKISESLASILPFPYSKKHSYLFQCLSNHFLTCKTLYEKKYLENRIKFRQRINVEFLKFIGATFCDKIENEQNQNKNSDSQSSDSSSDSSDKIWKGIEPFDGRQFKNTLKNITAKYQTFKQQTKKLNIWDKRSQIVAVSQHSFPSQIAAISEQNKQDHMLKQMIDELSQSYSVYIEQEDRLHQIANKLDETAKRSINSHLKALIDTSSGILRQIEVIIDEIKEKNSNHPDVITGLIPTLSPAMFTSILCSQQLHNYFPQLEKGNAREDKKGMTSLIKEVIKIWLDLKTRSCSFERIQVFLTQEKVDIVAFMRETLSPRDQVFKKKEWLCFEAEMKVQLWPSQLQTYKNLMQNEKVINPDNPEDRGGAFCQLNMGEGKTQVIIPLIILHTIYSKSDESNRFIPRINLLSSLFEQARGNFFRFISATGFQIPCFQIPFNRKVYLVKNQLNTLKSLISIFSDRVYILMTRQSRLSQILRFQQGKIIRGQMDKSPDYRLKCYRKDNKFRFDYAKQDFEEPLLPQKTFDVLDEIDALMYCKKSYIYSIGDNIDLDKDIMRFEILRVCLEVFLKNCLEIALEEKMVVSDQTDEDTLKLMERGQYPYGLRLIANSNETTQLRRIIARKMLFELNIPEYSFVNCLKEEAEREEIINYIIMSDHEENLPRVIPEPSRAQIYLLRGVLAYGIFEHCLSMRCGVDFGVPNKNHVKRIAVPYQAADIPSKTSQFEQPDVSVFLSYISYYTKGLTYDQVQQCLGAMLLMSKTSKQREYLSWLELMDEQIKETFLLKTVQSINYNSKVHRQTLFEAFKRNRKTISFWLIKCVFSKNLQQFGRSIVSSAWDLADVQKSVGFSGTKDNRWLYSNLLTWKPCKSPDIRGTDGKMIHLITKFTRTVCLIQENKKTLWQRFVDLALEKKVGCIIDAGALCVGKSLKDEIVPWIANHPSFDSKYIGISFCDNSGSWFVYDIEGKYYVPRGTTIPDHQTFVIFDQARTRGADLKMDADVVAALSIGPDLTKDSLMQAAGRLRKLGRNQSLIIMATHQVFAHLPKFPQDIEHQKNYIKAVLKKDSELLPKQLIAYCCKNSMSDNRDLLMQFAQLGWKYIHGKVRSRAYEQQLTTKLDVMYKSRLITSNVHEIGMNAAARFDDEQMLNHPSGRFIIARLQKYGKIIQKQAGTVDNICEREVQAEKQKEKEQQNEISSFSPVSEKDPPRQILTQLEQNPFLFDSKFKMTSNLIETTESYDKRPFQIPEIYFVKFNLDEMIAISIRQASNFIKQVIIQKVESTYSLHMLNELSIQDQMINVYGLRGAYASAKFLSGAENYCLEEEEELLKQCLESRKNKKQWQQNYNELVSFILRLKRIYLKKFSGSSLEKLITRLYNEG